MRSRLLISASAAALIAGAGLATAQDKGGPAAPPQNSSPAQQSAPPASKGGSEMQQRQEAPPARAQQDRSDQKQQRAQDQREQHQDRAQDQRNQRGKQAEDKSAPKAGSTATDTKSDRKGGGATTGQGAAGSSGSANLTTEQRTKISTSVRQTNVKRVTNVNFNLSVGTVVPRSVTLHPLPATVIEVYPQWRGYRFVLVEDEIIIIEPGSYRIVAVIDA